MYTSPFRLSGVTVVPFNDIFPARNSTKYLLEDPREPGTRLGNRAPEVVILKEAPPRRPGHDRGHPNVLLECCARTEGKRLSEPGQASEARHLRPNSLRGGPAHGVRFSASVPVPQTPKFTCASKPHGSWGPSSTPRSVHLK